METDGPRGRGYGVAVGLGLFPFGSGSEGSEGFGMRICGNWKRGDGVGGGGV
jgi:hypothetical protein